MLLQRPSRELIEEYSARFEQKNAKPENAIRLLCEKFPDNKSLESILLKSIVINTLYATQIHAIVSVAEHIFTLDVDNDLLRGVPDVVDKIAKVTIKGKQRNNYSFATKYCSFHNPNAYPIYDSFVVRLLTAYQKLDTFSTFDTAGLRDYEEFKRVLNEFQSFYELADISLKKLDMFLWGYGKELFR